MCIHPSIDLYLHPSLERQSTSIHTRARAEPVSLHRTNHIYSYPSVPPPIYISTHLFGPPTTQSTDLSTKIFNYLIRCTNTDTLNG